MTDDRRQTTVPENSRRSVLKGSAAAGASAVLGLAGVAAGQDNETQAGGNQTEGPQEDQPTPPRDAWMLRHEFRSGAVFRVQSPSLENAPNIDLGDGSAPDWEVRVIQYFNTNEEVYLFLPADATIEEGELYVLGDTATPVDQENLGAELVQATYEPVGQEDFPFDLEQDGGLDILQNGGGEAAVRPENFYAGALFRITSGTQNWVPEDVAESGWFTDYNTHHAEFLGTDEEFLFFPQEGAQVDTDQLYVMWDEWELFGASGRLVVTEFDPVNEDDLEVDDEFL